MTARIPEEAKTGRQSGSSELKLATAAEHSRKVSKELVFRNKSENHGRNRNSEPRAFTKCKIF
jgi:hypothetical protein